MAHSGVVDLDADLMCLGRRNLDILNAKLLARLPGHRGLTGNCLCRSMLVSLMMSFRKLWVYAVRGESARGGNVMQQGEGEASGQDSPFQQ